MANVLLIRHGRTTANASAVLAGRSDGVHLDATGEAQARGLAKRLREVQIAACVSSPLDRCQETARLLTADRDEVAVSVDNRLVECGYGDWTGRTLKELSRERLWRVVQAHPSGAAFPGEGGESLRAMQLRAVDAIREWQQHAEAEHGPDAVVVAVSHADVIKAILADALGMHLDMFQRLVVDPASVSVIRFTELRPFVVRLNDTGSDLSDLKPRRRGRRRASSDAVVGGGGGISVGEPAANK